MKGNKGEWSELYAFAYLMNAGKLYAADKDLNKIGTFFPITKAIREEIPNTIIEYRLSDDTVTIFKNGQNDKEVSKSEFDSAAKELLLNIPEGKRAFEIPSVETFFSSIYVNKIKAAAEEKQDITLQIHDIYTGIDPVCGFSIKSYLGANPTLFNAGKNTNFRYTLIGCNDRIMEDVNSTETPARTKNQEKIKKLLRNNCKFVMQRNSISARFIENLQFIDTMMPELLNYMVLYSYLFQLISVRDVVEKLKEENPLEYTNTEMYVYKVKKFLAASALGLTPEKVWEGREDANGGYITVTKSGDVVCFYLYNRKEFEQYLFDYTYFERPSTSPDKYDYLHVIKSTENNKEKYEIDLCLQIRFK